MTRCHSCNKKSAILICSYCKFNFCTSCIHIESHSCINTNLCIIKSKQNLETQLKQPIKKSKVTQF